VASSRSGPDRSNSRFERRTARNRKIILFMAVLMGLSLLAPLLGSLLTNDSAPAPAPEDDPFAAPEEPLEPEETVGPCGETPDDVPAVTSTLYVAPFPLTIDGDATYTLTLETTCGDIVIELVDDAPIAVNNLVNLAEDGYYDGVIFHRVTASPPVIQGGDPAGTGCGREECTLETADEPAFPGYTIEDELAGAEDRAAEVGDGFVDQLRGELDELLAQGVDPEDLGLPPDPTDDDLRELVPGGYARGVVAMANAGPDTIGSQFFIVWEDTPLPPLYTVVGTVVDGLDVVDDIAASPTQVTSTTPERPYEPVVIRSVQVTAG
jgi:peptidyl-prolyl cis-trans isomerase B (cyclophilin B)